MIYSYLEVLKPSAVPSLLRPMPQAKLLLGRIQYIMSECSWAFLSEIEYSGTCYTDPIGPMLLCISEMSVYGSSVLFHFILFSAQQDHEYGEFCQPDNWGLYKCGSTVLSPPLGYIVLCYRTIPFKLLLTLAWSASNTFTWQSVNMYSLTSHSRHMATPTKPNPQPSSRIVLTVKITWVTHCTISV